MLRLLIGRLCLAAQGRDAQLDQELARVAIGGAQASGHGNAEELLAPLSQAVAVLDTGDSAPALPQKAARNG